MQLPIYIMTYPFIWVVSILPFRLFYLFSDLIFLITYHIIGYRKKVVRQNLSLAFPGMQKDEMRVLEMKFYHHMCDQFLEMVKSLSISKKQLKKRFVYTNPDVLQECGRQHKSVIILASHYASWEWMLFLPKLVPHKAYAVYQKLNNPYFNKLVKKIRSKYGANLMTTDETVRKMLKNNNDNILSLNVLLSDQSPRPRNAHHWYPFLGVHVPVHVGAEVLAKRFDYPVFYFKTEKVKRGYYKATFVTLSLNPRENENYQISESFLKELESQIIDRPEHYLWTHRRWKHRDKVPKNIHAAHR